MDRNSFVNELTEHILPFWLGLKADKGFIGEVDFDLKKYPEADKGVILNSRTLWSFSAAYKALKRPEYLDAARHAYAFLRDYCLDKEYGGVYWMMSADGAPVDDQKHSYCQAFAVYGLAAYYDVTKDPEALEIALGLAEKIESCRDEYGYKESFTRQWVLRSNEELSENGLMAAKTMNTTLHVVEAYTALYRACGLKKVGDWLESALSIFTKSIYNPAKHRLEVFFDEKMNSLADMHSYGHDIEASWLLDDACAALGRPEVTKAFDPIIEDIARHVGDVAMNAGRLNNEVFEGEVNDTHIWWVQAEGIIGFTNLYRRTGETKYLDYAGGLWQYTREKMIDRREGSEWFYDLDNEDRPVSRKEIAGPWKCPYHDSRMCLEMMKRLTPEGNVRT